MDSVYLVYVDEATASVVYLVDAAFEDMCRPGTFDVLEGEDLQILERPQDGFDPSITNTPEYGWTVATAKPIYDEAGFIVGYACVDISMNEVVARRDQIIRDIALSLLALMAFVIVGGVLMSDRFLTRPINALSQASLRYYGEGEASQGHIFSDLNIRTGDEIEILADSMAKMERDINGYAHELRHMANSDSLTRVRNKRAYDRELQKASEDLERGEASVGLAMVDLNDLKSINDTYGHEKGDVALKRLCSLICHAFDHSPVFRIGGDEFAIVLRGHDLAHVEELVAQVNDAMEGYGRDGSLEPWEQISAAVGYAIYDPKIDADLEATFNRADEAMYARKKAMKREG